MRSYWIARLVTASIAAVLVVNWLRGTLSLVSIAVCALLLQLTLLNVAVYYLVHRSEDEAADRQFVVDTLIHIFAVFIVLTIICVAVLAA